MIAGAQRKHPANGQEEARRLLALPHGIVLWLVLVGFARSTQALTALAVHITCA